MNSKLQLGIINRFLSLPMFPARKEGPMFEELTSQQVIEAVSRVNRGEANERSISRRFRATMPSLAEAARIANDLGRMGFTVVTNSVTNEIECRGESRPAGPEAGYDAFLCVG